VTRVMGVFIAQRGVVRASMLDAEHVPLAETERSGYLGDPAEVAARAAAVAKQASRKA